MEPYVWIPCAPGGYDKPTPMNVLPVIYREGFDGFCRAIAPRLNEAAARRVMIHLPCGRRAMDEPMRLSDVEQAWAMGISTPAELTRGLEYLRREAFIRELVIYLGQARKKSDASWSAMLEQGDEHRLKERVDRILAPFRHCADLIVLDAHAVLEPGEDEAAEAVTFRTFELFGSVGVEGRPRAWAHGPQYGRYVTTETYDSLKNDFRERAGTFHVMLRGRWQTLNAMKKIRANGDVPMTYLSWTAKNLQAISDIR